VVASVDEAHAHGADVLVAAVAPPGGLLPAAWRVDLVRAGELGMSLVNPFHDFWGDDREIRGSLRPSAWIWDLRREPEGLTTATGAARLLDSRRLVTVGTDMAVGKMTASLELVGAMRQAGHTSEMVATGQVGISIVGSGAAVDAVRVDFAPGAIEREVLRASGSSDWVIVEGQGAIGHPAASANLAILRGAMPTHLLLVVSAGQRCLRNGTYSWVEIPALPRLISLYEELASGAGAFARPATIGVAANTSDLDESAARAYLLGLEDEVGLPADDPVRFGAARLADAWIRAAARD
jgi:uncharacterized NAD-dependent epimerase/dehydratase family protein